MSAAGHVEAIVIGGSAGSVAALGELLPALRSTCPPVLVVVHVRPDTPSALATLFGPRCVAVVREAEPFDPLEPGTVTFAPPDYHLLVTRDRRCAVSVAPPVLFSRPSIDVLFESAAHVFGAALVGVVLTGASHDGAAGLRAVREAGGAALVEDPATAENPTMPRAALGVVPDARVLSLAALREALRAMSLRV